MANEKAAGGDRENSELAGLATRRIIAVVNRARKLLAADLTLQDDCAELVLKIDLRLTAGTESSARTDVSRLIGGNLNGDIGTSRTVSANRTRAVVIDLKADHKRVAVDGRAILRDHGVTPKADASRLPILCADITELLFSRLIV